MRQQEAPVIVYASDETREALTWMDLVLKPFGGIEWRAVSTDFASIGSGIAFRAFPLGQSVAFQFSDETSGTSTLIAPAVGQVTDEFSAAMQDVELVFFDGTFWNDDELQAVRPGARAAREMNHLPICDGSLELLRHASARRKFYTHINNTNPILMPGSPERSQVMQAGIEIAWDGMEIIL